MFQTIDYDYTVGAASVAFKAGIPHFSVVSSSGLSENGTFPLIPHPQKAITVESVAEAMLNESIKNNLSCDIACS